MTDEAYIKIVLESLYWSGFHQGVGWDNAPPVSNLVQVLHAEENKAREIAISKACKKLKKRMKVK